MKTDKTDILALLRNSEDYISGQQLCDRFGVTRTAVWKVINQLKEEGYQIESVSGRGYRLMEDPADILSQSEIASRLTTKGAGSKYYIMIRRVLPTMMPSDAERKANRMVRWWSRMSRTQAKGAAAEDGRRCPELLFLLPLCSDRSLRRTRRP